MAALQYPIDFVVNLVTPNNALKVITSLNKPLAVTQVALKALSKTFVKLAPEMAKTVKTVGAFGDALFVLSLTQKAFNLLFGQTFILLDRATTELITFASRVAAAFNPAIALQNIETLRTSLATVVQGLYDAGATWKSTTQLVVDGATRMKVASGVYAQVAVAASNFTKTADQLKAVSDAAITVARSTGLAATQYEQFASEFSSITEKTELSNAAITDYGNALSSLSATLPVTIQYQNEFLKEQALLVSAGRLSANQVLAYGTVFEQLGVSVGDSSRAFNKLTQLLISPQSATTEMQAGFTQLGYSVEDLAALMNQPGGLNTALTNVLTRIQGLSNTDPSATLAALQAIVGTSSSGQPTAQTLEQLASSLGLVQQNLAQASDNVGNSKMAEELQKIALEANPTLRLNQALANLADTWGTVLRPAVVTVANTLADVVDFISGMIAAVRGVLQAILQPLAVFYQLLNTLLPPLNLIATALLVLNSAIIATKLSAIAFSKVGLALMTRSINSTRLTVGGLDLALIALGDKFESLYLLLTNKVKPGLTGLAPGVKASPWKQLTSTIGNLFGLLVKFAPTLLLTGLAFLAVRAAIKTYTATMREANKTKDLIKGINERAKELDSSFEAMKDSGNIFTTISKAASDSMEFIRDNISIFEHIGKAIGNTRLESLKFATQAEASANQAAIAYGDLLQTIDSFGSSYDKVVNNLKTNPVDPAALTQARNLVDLLTEQKEALEKVATTKEQEATKNVYIKSLDQQIRYVKKLSVGNDELANSIDQSTVAIEDMEKALDNLRTKVSDELSKATEKEIETIKESAQKQEEIERAKLDAINETAQAKFDAAEKQINRSQQLEDRNVERSRAKEDKAIEDRQAAEDKAIERRQAAEDKALQKQFDAREASIEKQQAAEDKAIERQQAAEDKLIERRQAAEDKAIAQRQAAEDKAIEKQQAAEDKAIERRQAAEDKAIERQQAVEDAALQKKYETEDEALQSQLDKELAAIEQTTLAKEAALNQEISLREKALQQQLDKELAAIELGLKIKEEALAKELAAREATLNKQNETRVNNLEAQQAKALQAAEAIFNAQQRAIASAFELRKQQAEQAHKNKLIQQETDAKARLQQLEEQFNTRQIDKQLAAVETRRAKDLDAISSREDAALKSFERQQQLQNANSPEERAKLQAEFDLADKVEAQRQAIRDKYDAERQAKEQEAEKAKAALEAEKAKKEQELAAAKKKEEEKAAAEQAKLEAEKQAALDKLELEKEKAKQERQAAYDKQQEEIKLSFEAKLNEARTLAEQQLQELRAANEQLLEAARNEAEVQRNSLQLENEKLLEAARLETENKITQLKLEAEKQAEQLRLTAEAEKEKRELAREQAKEQLALKREAEAEQRQLQREQEAERLKEEREAQAEQRAIKREADKEQRDQQRELEKEQRDQQREAAREQRDQQREAAREARQERFEAAKEQRDQQREAAKEAREKQREEQAYQRQIKREDEDYARQIKREEEAAARQEQYEAAKQAREKQYEAEKAEREKVLAEQIANREAELAKKLEVIKLQTQESIEQSYAEIVAGLKASADAIATAAAAANKAASSSSSSSSRKRFKGGTVKAGLPYWVGEDRRTGKLTPNSELFIPNTAGYVANAAQVWGMINAAKKMSRSRLFVTSTSNNPNKPDKQLVNELQTIQKNVAKLAKTVNDRTNTMIVAPRVTTKTPPIYEL